MTELDNLPKIIKSALKALYPKLAVDDLTIKLEHPADETHGDWATNVALSLSKELHLNPREIAKAVVNQLSEMLEDSELISEISVAGPGFINFHIRPEYYYSILTKEREIDPNFKQKLYLVEMGDTNTHKLPHIGHLFNYIVGDSLARIMKEQGHQIKRCAWQGDVGPHVAKCLYGWRKMGKPEPTGLVERMQTLQDAYTQGNKFYDSDEAAKEEMQEINRQLYMKDESIPGLEELLADWQKTKQWSLDFDEYFEARLGIKLDNRYLEGDLWKQGLEVVKNKSEIGEVFETSKGAVVFAGEKYGLHTRVFMTQKKTPTYEAKEIGLAIQKLKDYPDFDVTIIPTGAEQNQYFKVVIKAIELIYPELTNKIVHVGTGMISLKGIKMSSRTGNILTAYDLLETVKEKVTAVISTREGLSDEEKEDITQKITISAIKYALLKGSALQNTIFDINESIAFEGNSGPYLQYTFARIQSVLTQKEVAKIDLSTTEIAELLVQESELGLVRTLDRFSEVTNKAAETLSPHLVATYLFDLAQKFNSYYKQTTINSAETEKLVVARRILASKVADTLKAGLTMLGIETVTKM